MQNGTHYIGLRDLQLIELDMLVEVSKFLSERGLRYSLIGGTLLGAVRHGGFIPWDDDIDVGMPRNDYDRFTELKEDLFNETGLVLIGHSGMSPIDSPILKVINTNVMLRRDREIEPTCLWVDIMPIDGLPSSQNELAACYRRVNFYAKVLGMLTFAPNQASTKWRNFLKRVTMPLRRFPAIKRMVAVRLNSFGKRIPYGSTPYVGVLTWGMYGPGERFSIAGMRNMTEVQFEEHMFTCMSCWDEYLTGIYGEYMQLPPKEERTSHGIMAWRIDESGE